MTLKIDKAGRIVLPKPVRERFGLKAGMDLEVTEGVEGVLLTPLRQRPALINRNGLLVHRGKLPRALDWNRLIEDDRDERTRKLAGL
jgi:AbrB family looped-hinge helix DNA binding protein